tara:strand:- start:91 stop:243 length:153 start_codon:yes stop_codon:yes gene_type:complete
MSKRYIEQNKTSKYATKYSHTGKLPLVQSLTDPNVMVRPKVRTAQEKNKK